MTACIGMSTTLHGYMRGLIEDSDLEAAVFYFSCGRKHVLGRYVPCEATTLNTLLPVAMRGECSLAKVDPDFRPMVVRFLDHVKKADREGRVYWLAGNQQAIVESLASDTRVFWRKGWRDHE